MSETPAEARAPLMANEHPGVPTLLPALASHLSPLAGRQRAVVRGLRHVWQREAMLSSIRLTRFLF